MNLRQVSYKQTIADKPIIRPFNVEWKMKDGTIVTSHNMSNSHIGNCINFLLKRQTKYSNLLTNKDNLKHHLDELQLLIDIFRKELIWRDKNDIIINTTKK